MYNLATVLDENTTISHALNDSNLIRDMEVLEKEYIDASKQNVSDKYTLIYLTSFILLKLNVIKYS